MSYTNFMNFIGLTEDSKKPFVDNLKASTLNNINYRDVLFTNDIQVVMMNLKPSEDIKLESHSKDQFFYFFGDGVLETLEESYKIAEGTGLVIPGGVKHRIINSGSTDLKLFSVYGEPEHTK